MSDATTAVAALKENMRRFAEVRGWEPYHSPKNLVMALASEVGELCTVFRWLTADESRELDATPGLRDAVADEMADVANCLFLLSVHTGIDLTAAVLAKTAKNATKYPAPPPSGEGGGVGKDTPAAG